MMYNVKFVGDVNKRKRKIQPDKVESIHNEGVTEQQAAMI